MEKSKTRFDKMMVTALGDTILLWGMWGGGVVTNTIDQLKGFSSNEFPTIFQSTNFLFWFGSVFLQVF